jgi:phospholipid/cholesterol/gamma-HCH transport system permease protein
MSPDPTTPHDARASLAETPGGLCLAGRWNAQGLGELPAQMARVQAPAAATLVIDAAALTALDTVGAWLLHKLLQRLQDAGCTVRLQGLQPGFERLLAMTALPPTAPPASPKPPPTVLAGLGHRSAAVAEEGLALLSFVGETALTFGRGILHPSRLRWRPVLHNVRSAGLDALPIVGLLSFLLGIVVAYQGAEQLRRYGANIFVADLVGVSMLREFAPLITAIIVAGRSGSAYAAQIGTMAVTEEIDALRTLGVVPLELLVLPKVIALVIALPLLTVFADLLGVLGGMLMAQVQLGVSAVEFIERFEKAVSLSSYLVGLAKAPVFAGIIALVGCFQGLRTRGGADSVGLHTTRSVVQAIFLVIVADAAFSVAFSVLGL